MFCCTAANAPRAKCKPGRSGRAESARIQMRRAMGDVGCALSCLCSTEASSARRLRPAGLEHRLSDPSAPIPSDARPRLPRGVRLVHNEAQSGWILLAPERVFKADAIAAEIIKRCTGEVTFAELVDELAKSTQRRARPVLAPVPVVIISSSRKRVPSKKTISAPSIRASIAGVTESSGGRRHAVARPGRQKAPGVVIEARAQPSDRWSCGRVGFRNAA
jgi:pyrroloquinoline quinone biosynthesis protein D